MNTALQLILYFGILLLDKTGTITLGNRQAVELIPVNGANANELAEVMLLLRLVLTWER